MFLKSKKKFWLAGGTAPYYAGSSGGDAAATTAFLARVTAASLTIDLTHTNMYRNLINGLVSDGLISGATPKLDALYFFATNTVTGSNTALALMSLASSSFAATVSGIPTFTADQGYASTDNASNKALNSNFNPSTAGGHYTQNSAHISVWANNNLTAVQVVSPSVAVRLLVPAQRSFQNTQTETLTGASTTPTRPLAASPMQVRLDIMSPIVQARPERHPRRATRMPSIRG
jgi:hypothetical protein